MTNSLYTHTNLNPYRLHADTPEAQQRMQNTVQKLQCQEVASLVMQCASMVSQLYLLSPLSRKPLPDEPNHAMWYTIEMTKADANQYFADEDAYNKVQAHNTNLDACLPDYLAHLLISLSHAVQHTHTLFTLNQIEVSLESRTASELDSSLTSLRSLITPNYANTLNQIRVALAGATHRQNILANGYSFAGIQNVSPLTLLNVLAHLPNAVDTLASFLHPVRFFGAEDLRNIAQAEPRRDEVLRPHAPQ